MTLTHSARWAGRTYHTQLHAKVAEEAVFEHGASQRDPAVGRVVRRAERACGHGQDYKARTYARDAGKAR